MICDLCGQSDKETVIFPVIYAEKRMNVCLECLADGIKDMNKPTFPIEELPELPSFNTIDEIYGFRCPKCTKIIFTEILPYICECGQTITKEEIQNDHIQRKL